MRKRSRMKTCGDMSEEEIGRRWDASVTMTLKSSFVGCEDLEEGDSYAAAIARRATKHFLPGDVFPITWMNGGGERQPVWCRTRRGRSLDYFYVEYANHEHPGRYDFGRGHWHVRAKQHRKSKGGESLNGNALVILLEPPPGSIDGKWPSISSAAVRRYVVESTRSWHAGSRVGASTPAIFQGDAR